MTTIILLHGADHAGQRLKSPRPPGPSPGSTRRRPVSVRDAAGPRDPVFCRAEPWPLGTYRGAVERARAAGNRPRLAAAQARYDGNARRALVPGLFAAGDDRRVPA